MTVPHKPSEEPRVRLSVIIACHNAAATFGEQLDALAEQAWSEPWELIVADNGSTDETLELVERYRERFNDLHVVDASDRKGAAHARNVGARVARGTYLAFCDADDVVASDWIGAIGRALEQHELIASRFDGEKLNDPEVLGIRSCPQQEGLMRFKYSDFLPFASACGLAVRRSVFEELAGFDEDFVAGEDIDFCWRAQLQGRELQFVPEALVHYRMRSDTWAIYRQAFNYGLWTVPIYKRYLKHGMRRVPWHSGARMWVRLLLRLPRLARRSSRTKWLKEFGYRWGLVRGSIRYRILAL